MVGARVKEAEYLEHQQIVKVGFRHNISSGNNVSVKESPVYLINKSSKQILGKVFVRATMCLEGEPCYCYQGHIRSIWITYDQDFFEFKCENFFLLKQGSRFSFRFVIRDHHGKLVNAINMRRSRGSSPGVVEMIKIREALSWIKSKSWSVRGGLSLSSSYNHTLDTMVSSFEK